MKSIIHEMECKCCRDNRIAVIRKFAERLGVLGIEIEKTDGDESTLECLEHILGVIEQNKERLDRNAGETRDGIERIAAERKRQIEAEGFTAEHDDKWDCGEMATAAAYYVITEDQRHKVGRLANTMWSLLDDWWKPTPDNRIRELEKAGALIAAEIDRLLRLEASK